MAAARRGKFENKYLEKLYQGIEMGMPYEHACLYAGISRDTFENWRNGKFPRGVTKDEREEFAQKVEAAEGKAIAQKFGMIIRAANGDRDARIAPDWKAAAWLLEKRYPMIYGKTEVGMTHRGDPEQPVKVEVNRVEEAKLEEILDSLTDEQLALIDSVIDKLETAEDRE